MTTIYRSRICMRRATTRVALGSRFAERVRRHPQRDFRVRDRTGRAGRAHQRSGRAAVDRSRRWRELPCRRHIDGRPRPHAGAARGVGGPPVAVRPQESRTTQRGHLSADVAVRRTRRTVGQPRSSADLGVSGTRARRATHRTSSSYAAHRRRRRTTFPAAPVLTARPRATEAGPLPLSRARVVHVRPVRTVRRPRGNRCAPVSSLGGAARPRCTAAGGRGVRRGQVVLVERRTRSRVQARSGAVGTVRHGRSFRCVRVCGRFSR
jgi:hypothetical protein